jgi:cell wall-associated NlpC family hydrolase
VQLALEAAGLPAPRDADMQAAALGAEIDWRGGAALKRGDFVFWPGHVGIMTSTTGFIHANAHHMTVERETLAEAIERTKRATGDEVIGVRRI